MVLMTGQYCRGQTQLAPVSQGDVVLEIVNGTPGGHSVVGDAVTLRLIRGQEILTTLRDKVNDESQVIFKNVPREEGLAGLVNCEHEGAPFYGNIIPLIPAHANVSGKITVFDVTADTSSLSIPRHHISIKQVGNILEVSEFMRLKNSAMLAVKPEVGADYNQPVVLEMFLPKGYRNFSVQSYFNLNDLVWTEEGFFDPVPVAPGDGDIQFSYVIDIRSTAMDFSKKISLPTGMTIVFLALTQAQPQGLGNAISKLKKEDDTEYDYYQAGSHQAGDIIEFQLVGFVGRKIDPTWFVLGFVFVVVLFVVVWRVKTGKVKS